MQLEAVVRTQDLVAQEAGGARLFQRFLEAFIHLEDFAVDVVVADADAHGVGRDRHAFNHDVRIEAQDVAVLERARLAFVRVADEVLLAGERARHEAPLQAGREARAATAAQTRRLDFGDHVFRLHAGGQDLLQGFVAAALDVVFKAPVGTVDISHDLRLDVATVQAHRIGHVVQRVGVEPLRELLVQVGRVHADSPCTLRAATSASSFSSVMRTHICLLFTISTGESPQAPMHSPSTSVNWPSAVVWR
ncbi:hypothetical protein D3C73_787800 [compost metagenome]